MTASRRSTWLLIVMLTACAALADPPSFRRDVMPVITKGGCNSGSCHGSSRGQDGFHLSLFGYDPAGDYAALTRELPGRRTSLAEPASSLILTKATNAVPHSGGVRFAASDPAYRVLLDWLAAGAPDDPPNLPGVAALKVDPPEVVLARNSAAPLRIVARYADGAERDVTRWAVYLTTNDVVAEVSADGSIAAKQPGEATILARFDALTVGCGVIVPRDGAPPPSASAANYIDEAIGAKLAKLRIAAAPLCDDATFLRRATIDLVGLPPTVDEHDRFLADASADKREKLVDTLLSRKEFVEIWVMKWAERLQLRSTQQVSYKAMLLYYDWLQSRIAAGEPIDRIVRDILASDGGTFTSPATNFYQLEQDTLKLAENTAQAFLGARIQCAQCHNHPFDRWTMDDYYGFAAFFAQIGRKAGEDPRETIVFNSGGGEVKHPVGGRAMPPTFLGGGAADVAGRDRRAVLAEWLTSRDNRMFSRSVANFVWAHFFPRGVVEPVDDVRVSNPPSNPALLDAIADRLVAYDFDLRRLVRDIVLSHAYQRSTATDETNAEDAANFSHASPRRIRAETLLDCISRATQTRDKFQGLPLGARAVQIADGAASNYFLTTFGRAKRDTVCTCEVVMEPSLSQALHLINGDTVQRKIREGNVVGRLIDAGDPPERIVRTLYVACLCREPTTDETTRIAALIAESGDTRASLEDLFWALLNSREFVFNR